MLQFDALTDLCTDINVRINNSILTNKSRMKKEKLKQKIKKGANLTFLKKKFQMSKVKNKLFQSQK